MCAHGLATSCRLVSLKAACTVAALMTALPAASAMAAERLPIVGRVVDQQNQPVAGATVYVSSAGVRVGTSPFCPSCYADCGKRDTTDADGRYTIDALDPTLVFKLLVVAGGYRPAVIAKVDPQKRPTLETTLEARPIPDDPTRVVRGQVIDPYGRPAAGALVVPRGCQNATRRWWGRMPGVDSLAITDQQGRFAIVCDEPVLGLDLKVVARGAVRKRFALVKPGAEEHRLKLEEGTTVMGRVLHEGQPVAGVSVGIVQTDRGTDSFLGEYQIGTDEAGRFSIPNLPTGESLAVYGIIDSMRDIGALPVKQFRSASGATTDVGDLTIRPAHTIAGRIVLADGKPVPPRTRIMISRDAAWDSTFAEVDANGAFVASGIPSEVVEVIARVKGYHVSPKNKSFDPWLRTQIKGLVTGDIGDLVILYEPGRAQGLDHSDNKAWQAAVNEHRRLDSQALAGVTADLETPPADDVPSRPQTTKE